MGTLTTQHTNMKTYILLAVAFAAFGLAASFEDLLEDREMMEAMEMDRMEDLFEAEVGVNERKRSFKWGKKGGKGWRRGCKEFLYFSTDDLDTKCKDQIPTNAASIKKGTNPCDDETAGNKMCICVGFESSTMGKIFFGKPKCATCQLALRRECKKKPEDE